jgi:hypothetical protein
MARKVIGLSALQDKWRSRPLTLLGLLLYSTHSPAHRFSPFRARLSLSNTAEKSFCDNAMSANRGEENGCEGKDYYGCKGKNVDVEKDENEG